MATNENKPISRIRVNGSSVEALRRFAEVSFERAAANAGFRLIKEQFEGASGIWTEFPGHLSMRPGERREQELVVLFFDIRNSTLTSREYGADVSYVTYSTVIPTLGHLIVANEGFIVDYPGDGIMAIWGFGKGEIKHALSKCIETAEMMKAVLEGIINPLFATKKITHPSLSRIPVVKFGIGIARGHVVLTKFRVSRGYQEFSQAKAIGYAVNHAAKLSSQSGRAKVDSGILIAKSAWQELGEGPEGPYKYDDLEGDADRISRVTNLPKSFMELLAGKS